MFDVFLTNTLLAAFLASIASGVISPFVVVKKLSSLSGSIAHSVLGGIGFFIFLKYRLNIAWAHPLLGAFLAAVISALLIGYVHIKYKQNEDAIIATIWATGMSIGIIFASLTPGYIGDFTGYLFGNILWTTKQDLIALALCDIILIGVTTFLYNKLLTICFDEEIATLQGISVKFLYILLLTLISIAIVLLMQIIGIILVITLLTIPALISRILTNNFF